MAILQYEAIERENKAVNQELINKTDALVKDVEKQSVTTSTLSVKSLPLSSDDATSSAESFSSSFVNFLHPNNMMRLQHNGITKQPPTDKSTHHDLITISIAAGVGVLCLILFTVILIICFRRIRRRRNKRKDLIAAKYDKIFTTLRRTSPVDVISTRRQISSQSTGELRATYNSFDLITERPQEGYQMHKIHTNGERLTKFYSIDNGSVVQCSPKRKQLKKSKSVSALPKVTPESETCPTISFSLKFDPKTRQLRMKLVSVNELPVKCYGYDVSAVVYLFPRNTDGVHSRSVPGKRDIQLNETFLFDDMMLTEVEKSTIRIVLQYKRKVRSGKDDFLGEMYMKFCDFDWSTNEAMPFTAIPLKPRVKKGTPEKYLLEDLGTLFVCLEYQSIASRMKVMVRKANNLPKSDKLIGDPGHYVLIYLLKNKEAVRVQETKAHTGYSPIWNQPFLFDLGPEAEAQFSIDFVIMRKKLHTKDAVVGHVTIGEQGCRSGRNHWKEIMSPRPSESAKWHSITPMLNSDKYNYNISVEDRVGQ